MYTKNMFLAAALVPVIVTSFWLVHVTMSTILELFGAPGEATQMLALLASVAFNFLIVLGIIGWFSEQSERKEYIESLDRM